MSEFHVLCFTIVSIFAPQVIESQLRIVPQFWAQNHQTMVVTSIRARKQMFPGLFLGKLFHNCFTKNGVLSKN